jgi:hypothetical protein
MLDRWRTWLFGSTEVTRASIRQFGARLIEKIAMGGLQTLSDDELMAVVDRLLTSRSLRVPLRGNVRFLGSVAAQYHRKRTLTPKQRQAILNILERAYPHNLAAELKTFSPDPPAAGG